MGVGGGGPYSAPTLEKKDPKPRRIFEHISIRLQVSLSVKNSPYYVEEKIYCCCVVSIYRVLVKNSIFLAILPYFTQFLVRKIHFYSCESKQRSKTIDHAYLV
jgi:hypothetical protein